MAVLQSRTSPVSPEQSSVILLSSRQRLVRDCRPPPHVRLHSVQSVHALHVLGTEPGCCVRFLRSSLNSRLSAEIKIN